MSNGKICDKLHIEYKCTSTELLTGPLNITNERKKSKAIQSRTYVL